MLKILQIICFILVSKLMVAQSLTTYVHAINNATEFNKLKGAPLNNLYSGIKSIKIVYDVKNNKIYYLNSTKYRYHIDFCVAQFGIEYDIAAFNKENYTTSANRQFILSTLNYYLQQNIYTLEFVSEDNITTTYLQTFFNEVKKSIYLKSEIKVLLNNYYLLKAAPELKNIATLLPENIFENQKYQPLIIGTAIGTARKVVDMKKQYNSIKASDIIFLKGAPLIIPNSAGVITDVLQTPLSHINVLCNNRKTPACAWVNFDSTITAMQLWDKPVKITITQEAVKIEPAIALKIINAKPKKKIKIIADTITKGIIQLNNTTIVKGKTIGAKAYGIVQLKKVEANNKKLFNTPNAAAAIPFYYYLNHLKHPYLKTSISQLYKIPITNLDSIEKQLKKIRKLIKAVPLNKELLQQVQVFMADNGAKATYRFRSSSNAEDLAKFSGAGLYTSTSANLLDSNKTVEEAIKKVWASIWNYNAYIERQIYNIDQSTVYMAVLIHKGFGKEDINGVAITKHLYRNDFPGVTVNVQIGETPVVNPPENISCDQLVIIPSDVFIAEDGEYYQQYITRSNLSNGKNILDAKKVQQLMDALTAVKSYIYYRDAEALKNMDYDNFGLDIEFKFIDDKLYLKQVRPYK